MASIVIAGDTSGAVTIAAPATAGTPTLTLPTTSGTLVVTGGAQTIEFAAGSAASPSITFTGDTNTGIFSPAADTIAFTEGGVESMRIDSSGNVGIGTSSPQAKLQVTTGVQGESIIFNNTNSAVGSNSFGYEIQENGSAKGRFRYRRDGTGVLELYQVAEAPLVFGTNNAERMRITSSGNVGIASTSANTPLQVWGTTNSGYATSNAITSGGSAISNSASLWNGSSLRLTANFGGAVNYTGRASELVFGADNGNFGSGGGFGQANLGAITAISEVGNAATLASSMLFYTTSGNNISERMRIDSSGNLLVGTTTSVGTSNGFYCPALFNFTSGAGANTVISSDGLFRRSTSSLKYKKDVQDATHGLAEVLQLRPVTYKGKAEFDGDKVFGGLIAEEVHDAGLTEFVQYAEDGSPDALSYGNMVSLLTKAIQEQQAMIEELKDRINVLEGAK